MRRGEIWWGRPRVPGEQPKRRPFLVVSRDAFNKDERYAKVMVVQLNTAEHRGGPYDWDIDVPRGVGRLPERSVAKCNEIYTIWKSDLDGLIGALPSATMARIDRALALVLALPAPFAAND